ncbi:protein FAM207A isoform X2 [Channa argus]|uniref:protein FAM207A isoform X2 n=1 Tax=Channa argus TaxID=215402 RepID=UPI00351FCD80
MVGKIKPLRFKRHQASANSDWLDNLEAPTGSLLLSASKKPLVLKLNVTPTLQGKDSGKQTCTFLCKNFQTMAENCFPTGIFDGTTITPEALVQSLTYEETPNVGSEEKTGKSKKEKMKERREKWLNKISSIKQTKEEQLAKARRQATPVVGDLRPLVDALPELCQLMRSPTALCHKSMKKKVRVKNPEPTDFSQMNMSQKRKLLETERSWFSEAVKTFSTKKNHLAEISEQLRKRMKQEED